MWCNCPQVSARDLFQDPLQITKSKDTQVPYIKWRNICIKTTHILPNFKSSLDYLQATEQQQDSLQHLMQCKWYVYSCLDKGTNSSSAFWNFLVMPSGKQHFPGKLFRVKSPTHEFTFHWPPVSHCEQIITSKWLAFTNWLKQIRLSTRVKDEISLIKTEWLHNRE